MQHNVKSLFRYLPASERSQAWGLHVVSGGFSLIPPGIPYPPGRHPEDHHFTWERGRILNDYTFVYIPRGQGVFDSKASRRKKVKAGDLFIVFPGIWHRYRPDINVGWDEYWVEFDGEYAERLMSQGDFRPEKPVLSIGHVEPLLRLFTSVYEAMQAGAFGFEQVVAAQCVEIIARTLAAVRGRNIDDGGTREIIRRAREAIEGGLGAPFDARQLARRLHVSYSWLRRAFRLYTGFGPHQYLLRLRIDRACHLLAHTRTPVYDVAQQTGFESPYYFSRIFRKKTEVAPAAFRKAALDKHPGA